MKKIISVVIMLMFSVGITAQKKHSKKQNLKEESQIVSIPDEDLPMNEDEFQVDSLKIKSGTSHVFLVDVNQYVGELAIPLDHEYTQEEKELLQNFKKDSFKIIKIQKQSYITFENGQYLDISDKDSSYNAVAYWSGKNEDDIKVQENQNKSTEFIAEQLGIKKESSYIIKDKQYRKEVATLQTENNFTAKSKEVMDAYLKILSTSEFSLIEKSKILFNTNQEKVKTINTFLTEKNGKKNSY